jgi:glutathione S-transferase
MPPLVMRLVFEKVKTSPMPFFVKPVAKGISDKTNEIFIGPMIKTHLDFVENHLANNTWFLGDNLSAADIQMSFPLEASVARGIVGKGRPHITDWVQRIHARPAYQRALEKGGDYDFA